jgi:hypothetical protein
MGGGIPVGQFTTLPLYHHVHSSLFLKKGMNPKFCWKFIVGTMSSHPFIGPTNIYDQTVATYWTLLDEMSAEVETILFLVRSLKMSLDMVGH